MAANAHIYVWTYTIVTYITILLYKTYKYIFNWVTGIAIIKMYP